MAAPSDLSVLLRLYTSKYNTPTIVLSDFCDYLQKYARHYLEENPELVVYLEDTQNTVLAGLEKLEAESKAFVSADLKGKRTVFIPHFYIDRMVQRYRDIDERPEVPYPLAGEIPSGFPPSFLKPIHITSDFTDLLEGGERTNSFLYQMIFPDDTPPIVFPASVSPEKLLDLSLSKIRLFLRKDESRDYIQKRLMVANPGKEITIKNYLTQFLSRPSEAIRGLKHSGEAFLFWSYLCSFVRQDYTKKAEKTPEEHALIQSVFVTEYLNNFYKNKAQQDLQRETALKNLELCFQKPPYYYDMESIQRFSDSRGVPLLGQYKNTDLDAFIREKTSESSPNALPYLLVFKTEHGNRYFVLKEKLIPLIVKLCGECRKQVKDIITRSWYQLLIAYRQEGSMKSQADFEKKIEEVCREEAPILYSVLTASFMPLLAMESQGGESGSNGFRLFEHGRVLPYSELLMLDRQELLTDTRILLPFWYTLPVISAIVAFFRRPRSPRKAAKQATAKRVGTEEKEEGTGESRQQRKAELRNAANEVERRLIPAGSSLDNELLASLDLWNRNLNPTAKMNLTEDVNSLIRDYVRRVVKTLKASSFDLERVENLATALVDTPSLMKIKHRDALLSYVQLYIIQLIKNIT
ncbi:MAG TPA: hypothetical protein PLU93_04955 [Treponemataceae bacterium]|jgi:hypothetical protein|nr:hypothetical protein [Treponemataceae bacterium]